MIQSLIKYVFQSRALCITSAFLMHLAFLTAFVWMAVEAYTLYLQVRTN